MKIVTFSTLQAVLTHGSFAKAAQVCNMTPSAVSMQMRQLETYLGKALFDRSSYRIRPLPVAFEISRAMSAGIELLASHRNPQSGRAKGKVRLGIIASMVPALLPVSLRLLRESYPELIVIPTSGRSIALTNAVINSELDCAIVAQPERHTETLVSTVLETRELVLLAPPKSTERSLATLLRKYDLIQHDRTTLTGRMAAAYVAEHCPQYQPAMELDSPSAVVSMVSAGFGVSVMQLSELGTLQLYPVRVLKLKSAPQLQISFVSRHTDRSNQGIVALESVIHRAVASTAQYRLHGYSTAAKWVD